MRPRLGLNSVICAGPWYDGPALSGERARHCIEIIEKAFTAARTGTTQALTASF